MAPHGLNGKSAAYRVGLRGMRAACAQAMELPPEKRDRLEVIVRELREVPRLCAIALGGSHARGSHRADSDLDIGLYYHSAAPLAISLVGDLARGFAATGIDPGHHGLRCLGALG